MAIKDDHCEKMCVAESDSSNRVPPTSSRHLERHRQPCGSQNGRGSTEWPLVDAD